MSYSALDSALRDRTVDYMKYAMEDALAFGTNRVFLNTGCHPRDLPREEGWKRTADSYRRLCDVAEKWGIQLVLEQLQPYESNLVLNLADIKRMLREVDSPALCCCVDLVAMEVAGDTLEDFCKDLGDKLQWVHYSDSHHLILGDGDYGREKLEGWVRTLEKYHYQNCIDLEINDSLYWEDPHTSVQRSEALRREKAADAARHGLKKSLRPQLRGGTLCEKSGVSAPFPYHEFTPGGPYDKHQQEKTYYLAEPQGQGADDHHLHLGLAHCDRAGPPDHRAVC